MLIITRTQQLLITPGDISEATAEALIAHGEAAKIVKVRVYNDTSYTDQDFRIPLELGEMSAKLLLIHRPCDVAPIGDRQLKWDFSECN